MKIYLAALYARYETSIAEESDMRQDELFLGQPLGKRLVLRLRRV